jgi:hypothetical protein
MSRTPLTKYDHATIAGQQHLVPQGWGSLFSSTLPVTLEKLGHIERTRYQAGSAKPPLNGEVWTCESSLNTATTSQAHKVSAGYLNMVVISGALTVTKNGTSMYVRIGEKVSFQLGDIFSLDGAPKSTIAVRNEAAHLTPFSHPEVKNLLAPVSQSIVNIVRAQLGLYPEEPAHTRVTRDNDRSSSAYRGQPKYGRSGSY